MPVREIYIFLAFFAILVACNRTPKNSQKANVTTNFREFVSKNEKEPPGLRTDSLDFLTRPLEVLLTNHPSHRLLPIYKINFREIRVRVYPYTGTNRFHANYARNAADYHARWQSHNLPGLRALYGEELVNIVHFDTQQETQTAFFPQPVLVKTLYYPAFEPDSLHGQPIIRDFYLVSCFEEDTNTDGYINGLDLRRLYWFNLSGQNQGLLIPKTHNVLSSEYDPDNDYFYVYARLDQNQNGQSELEEPIEIFWIDLQAPTRHGKLYQAQ